MARPTTEREARCRFSVYPLWREPVECSSPTATRTRSIAIAVDGRIDRLSAGLSRTEQRFRHQSFPAAGHASIGQVGDSVAADPLPDGARVRILAGTDGAGLEIDAVVADKARPPTDRGAARLPHTCCDRLATSDTMGAWRSVM